MPAPPRSGARRRAVRPTARRSGAIAALFASAALVAGACGSTHSSAPATRHSASASPQRVLTEPPLHPTVKQLVATGAKGGDALGGAVWYDTYANPIRRVELDTPGEAAMAGDGSVAVIGAPGAAGGRHGARGAGAVYVFARAAAGWSQAARLVAPNGAAYDAFGSAVAVSGDGHDVLVGAPYADRGDAIDEGAAYLFHAVNGVWNVVELHASSAAAYDNFGWSVSLSRDGLTALVGATGHSVGRVRAAGAAYLYTRPSPLGSWSQQGELHATKPASHDDFGAVTALSDDGSTALVTSQSHVDSQQRRHTGAAFVFGRARPSSWRLLTTFGDPRNGGGAHSDDFGIAAAISGNGRVIAVAAPNETVGDRRSVGYVDVYATDGTWTDAGGPSQLTLGPARPTEFLYYGSALAMSRDGRRLMVGASGGGLDDQGGLEIVDLSGGTAGSLLHDAHRSEVAAPNSASGRFGTAAAVSTDGGTALVTAPRLTVGKVASVGAAYVLTWPTAAA